MTKLDEITTRKGTIRFPAYIPVTTFGDKYPLDNLIRPYLPRLAPAVMVSFPYAKKINTSLSIPLLLDSGGFMSLFKDAKITEENKQGILQYPTEEGTETIRPIDVLDLQEKFADVAFSLDFPIPPGMDQKQARHRLKLTIANAHWALENRRRRDLPLYACLQAWNADSARECARAYSKAGFDGIAIGGLVPRVKDFPLVAKIIEAVRAEITDLPLHVFGLGKPEIVKSLFKLGVNSVDSSSYIKYAADGRLWSRPDYKLENASTTERLHLALCNLATATGCSLPLSASRLVFSTHVLA